MNRTAEPCISCGRPTQAGSRLFTDRRMTRLEDGTRLYLCGDCNERAISHYGQRPTERDMVQIAARAAGLGFAGHRGVSTGAGT
jgi:hypothetical protein